MWSRLGSPHSASGGLEVRLFIFVPSMSADCLRCHFGMEVSRTFGFDETLPGVFVTRPSRCYVKDTQHPASSLLGPRRVVS